MSTARSIFYLYVLGAVLPFAGISEPMALCIFTLGFTLKLVISLI